MQVIFTSLSRHISQSKVERAMSEDTTRDAPAKPWFLKPVLDFFKRHIALIVLAVFLFTGVWVLDDYGVGQDYEHQRKITVMYLDYVLFERDFTRLKHDMFYGLSFELPLLLLERALGLDATRDIHLMRHLVTHLFFLVSGFFCYLLAYRLFGSRLLAVLAMLMFLLHPRIYTHSFFNSKDIPFLSMFMICLYLTYWAFMKGGTWRFLALGVAVGVLINLRIMGVTLFAMIVGMQILDVFGDRRHMLGCMSVFVLSCAATLYAISPGLWGDPVGNFTEWFAVFSQHPTSVTQLFRGDVIVSTDINPPEYVPVWMSITTPPVMLVLGVAGISVVLLRGLMNPRDVLANTRLRFWFMLIGCFMLPILGLIVLSANVYHGWRQMYFLYAPFCMLATFGFRWLISAWKELLPSPPTRVFENKWLICGTIIANIAPVVVAMFSIHPHQYLYFNFLVDRTTPEHLRSQYDMNYWHISFREGYEHLLEIHPSASIHVQTSNVLSGKVNREILAASNRERMISDRQRSDFYITSYRNGQISESNSRDVTAPLVHSRVIYNSKVLGIAAVDLSLVDDAVAARYREMHSSIVSGKPVASSEWDIYVDDATLTYIKESCVTSDFGESFFLHVTVDDIDELPEYMRRAGYSTRNFDFVFGMYGVRFDGRCMAVVRLLDDGISGIRTGQFASDGELWSIAVNLRTEGESAYRMEYESVIHDDPAISSEFDVHLRDGRLIYVREPCDASDTEAEFFLDITPSDVEVLPPVRMDSGFEHLRFIFETRGLMFDDMCVASIGLPDYEIERIRTWQLIASKETVSWEGGYNASAAAELPRVVEELRGRGAPPMIQSHYNVYLDDRRLVYFKSDCVAGDVEAPFFVHLYPEDLDDLLSDRSYLGFESFSFRLLDDGVMIGDGCFTSFDLPDYDVAGFSTGQFLRGDGTLWEDGHSFAAAELPSVVDRLRGRSVEPVIRSYFDVYMDNGRLIYVRDSCSVSDTDAKFFLHIVPSSDGDLPLPLRESGFDNLGFVFETRGLMFDGMCVAGIGLPDYDIKRIRTGQWDPEQQRNLWKEEFDVADK